MALAWLHSASYAPGLAPRVVAAPAVGTDLAVRSDGEDTLLLVPDDTPRGGEPVRLEFPDADATIEVARRSQTVWVVLRPGLPVLTTIAGSSGGQRVVRVPGPPPGRRWSAEVEGDRVPPEGTNPVEVVPRPFAATVRDVPSLAVVGVVAVLLALAAARRASMRSLRAAVRGLLVGLLLLPGAPVAARLLQRLTSASGWSAQYLTAEPALVWVVMALVLPVVVLRLARAAVRTRDPSPADRVPPAWIPPLTALLAFGLLLLAALLGQAAALRFLPGLVG